MKTHLNCQQKQANCKRANLNLRKLPLFSVGSAGDNSISFTFHFWIILKMLSHMKHNIETKECNLIRILVNIP